MSPSSYATTIKAHNDCALVLELSNLQRLSTPPSRCEPRSKSVKETRIVTEHTIPDTDRLGLCSSMPCWKSIVETQRRIVVADE